MSAPDRETALRALVDMQARLLPELKPIAYAFELLRRQDLDAERGWQDRLDSRYEQCRSIVARLVAEARLKPGIAPDEAADLAWALTSFRMWDDLVIQRGWTAARYSDHVAGLLIHALIEAAPAAGRQPEKRAQARLSAV